jgi:hypothetical protein
MLAVLSSSLSPMAFVSDPSLAPRRLWMLYSFRSGCGHVAVVIAMNPLAPFVCSVDVSGRSHLAGRLAVLLQPVYHHGPYIIVRSSNRTSSKCAHTAAQYSRWRS